jgi:uncharacterized RDD family membrane protein YckC
MKPAGMAARATALIVDGLLVFFGLGAVVALLSGEAYNGRGGIGFHLHGGAALVWLVLSFGYWIVCERMWGMTIGKRLFSIRVEARGGGRPSWAQSIVRNVLRLIDGFPFVIPYLLGFIVAMGSGARTRIGDRVAGTRVVGS